MRRGAGAKDADAPAVKCRRPIPDKLHLRPAHRLFLAAAIVLPFLAGCDQLGIETPAQTAAKQDAEGRAIGSACRQVGRPLENCFAKAAKDKKNKFISRASIFAGWKDMDAYMRENNLAVEPMSDDAEPTPAADTAPAPEGAAPADGKDGAAKDDAKGGDAKPATDGKPADGKPGAKPETKVDAPANSRPKAGGKISAAVSGPVRA